MKAATIPARMGSQRLQQKNLRELSYQSKGRPSLREYLLVAQDRMSVELYTPSDHGRWLLSVYEDLGKRVHLPSIDCELPLAEVYDRLDLDFVN